MGDPRIEFQVGRVDGNFSRNPDPTAYCFDVRFSWSYDTAHDVNKKKKKKILFSTRFTHLQI